MVYCVDKYIRSEVHLVGVSRKAVLSLAITIVLLGIFTALGFTGLFAEEGLFSFPGDVMLMLLLSLSTTLYLTVFLLFNLRHDPVIIVKDRLKRLQIILIEKSCEQGGELDWENWSRELDQRRDEIKVQLKRGLKGALADKAGDIDAIIDRSWDELLEIIESRKDSGIYSEEKLTAVVNRILSESHRDEAARTSRKTEDEKIARIIEETNIQKEQIENSRRQSIEGGERPISEGQEEELEELDVVEDFDGEIESSGEGPYPGGLDIASRIEFETSESESSGEEAFHMDLEIVSPFSIMLSDVSLKGKNDLATSAHSRQESTSEDTNVHKTTTRGRNLNLGIPLFSRPFYYSRSVGVETLEAITYNGDEKKVRNMPGGTNRNGIIEERGGVPYISAGVLKGSGAISTALDLEFKDLVDSVSK